MSFENVLLFQQEYANACLAYMRAQCRLGAKNNVEY